MSKATLERCFITKSLSHSKCWSPPAARLLLRKQHNCSLQPEQGRDFGVTHHVNISSVNYCQTDIYYMLLIFDASLECHFTHLAVCGGGLSVDRLMHSFDLLDVAQARATTPNRL